MSYFEEAIDILMQHPQIESKRGVGVCGISKGGEACLAMAATMDRSKLGAIAVMNTIIFHGIMPVEYKGQPVCDGINSYSKCFIFVQLSQFWFEFAVYPAEINEHSIKHVGDNMVNMYGMFGQEKELKEEFVIPFASCESPILFIAGTDDKVYPSHQHVTINSKKDLIT